MNASDNVDLYSGAAELSIELVNLPGRNGLDLNVTLAYSSRVYDAATQWNLTEPTGVLGLGWSLPACAILASYGSNVSDVSYFLVAGAESGPLTSVGAGPDGSVLYQLENYQFWQVSYYPALRMWKIVREDGNVWIYGDQNSSPNAIQWGIGWGNWRGASSESAGQKPIPLVFNLSRIVNRFGDSVTWQYDNVLETVGAASGPTSAAYTQASYLAKITGVTGESVVFSYQDKTNNATIQEFVIPHTNPAAPNAFQDRYQTRYLDSITVFSADGVALFTQKFLYVDGAGQPAFLGTGAMAKRLLTGIIQTPASFPAHLPGPKFAYCGQDAADQVSATAPFNATTHCLYGAIKSVTTAGGGINTYQYGAVSPALSTRAATVAPPVVAAVTFSQPRFYIEDNYTAATWLGSDNTLRVLAYCWDGRWIAPGQAAGLDSLPLASAASYNAVPVSTSARLFGAFSQNQVHLYCADTARAGMWIQPSVTQGGSTVNYFTTDFAAPEAARLATGNSFAAALGLSGGHLFRYRFTGAAWQADPAITLSAGTGTNLFDTVASKDYLFALATLQAPGANPLCVFFYLLDESGAWQPATFRVQRQLSQVDSVTLFAGDTFTVAMLTAVDGGATDVEYIAFWWSADGSKLFSESFGVFSVSGSVTPPVIKESSVAIGQMLFRFDGVGWNYQNVSSSPLQAASYADDLILRILQTSATQFTYDLSQYNPNTGVWSSALSAVETTGANLNVAPQHNLGVAPYAVLDSKLYYRQPNAAWQLVSLTIPALTGDDAKSPVLAGDRFFAYQQSGATIVVPLENGTALPQISIAGNQIYTPLTTLVGERAFISYTGAFGDSSSTLTLHRVVDEDASGNIQDYVVTVRIANNGYQSVATAYAYNAAVAISSQSRGLRSNQTTIVAGSADPTTKTNGWIDQYFFNGMIPAETPALPYPVDAAFTNAPAFYSLAAGGRYDSRVFPAGAAPTAIVSEDVNYLWVYSKTLGQLAVGYFLRTLKATATVDSVSTSNTASFIRDGDTEPITGLVFQTASANFNSTGQAEQIVTKYKYFWEIYDPTRALNLLSAVCQTTMQTVVGQNATITGIYVTTYQSDWGTGPGLWAPNRTYRALSASAPAFNSWQPNQNDPAGWLRTATILDLNSFGLPRRTAGVDGSISAIVYDSARLMSVASFGNADPDSDEASYYGFDPYELAGGWGWSGAGHSIQDNITTIDYHSGVQCLMIAGTPGQKAGPVRRFQPGGQSRTYVFGCWIKTQSGFNPAQGQAGIDIAVYTAGANQTNIATLTIPIVDTQNQWVYQQQTVNLPQLRSAAQLPPATPLYLRILGWNQNTTNFVLLDNLRFSPIDATFGATVFDPDSRLVTAALGNNAETIRTVYDAYGRIVATIGPGESVKSLSAQSYSRDLTAGDSFVPNFPNSQLALSTTSRSLYYDFHDGSTTQWTFTNAGGAWSIAGGQLVFTGTSTDPLGSIAALNLVAFTDFAVRVFCAAHSGSAGIGNGDAFVYWDNSSQAWKLVRRQLSGPPTLVATSDSVGFRPDWIYSIVEGLLMFYAGGVMVFAYDYQNPNSALPNLGKPALLLANSGSFDDLVVLNDPQLSVIFQDGFENVLQSVALLGFTSGTTYTSQGQGAFLDSLGRPYIQRNAAQPALAIAAPSLPIGANTGELLEGGQTVYLVNSAGQPVTLQQYLDGVFGFDYTKYQFETSPLSRVTSVVLPRESNQLASHFTIGYQYGPATAAIIQGILPVGTEQNYFLLTATDQDGIPNYRILDQTGKTIAWRTLMSPGVYQTAAVEYDASGNPVVLKQPNFFAPPPNSVAATWQETRTYTFNGLLSTRTTPDSGQTAYLYDNVDRLRFVSAADGAALSPPQFVYLKYDSLGRCIEEGYIQDAAVTWATLANSVNDPSYPNLASVAGSWLKRRVYDSNSQGDATNLLGRLCQVSINNQSNPDVQTFSYDINGNVMASASVTPSVDAAAYTSSYTYDTQGHISTISYPAKTGETPFQAGYYYDRLGRPASVGKPLDPFAVIDPTHPATGDEDLYAAYFYAGNGALLTEQLNNRTGGNFSFNRNYTYDGPGWLTQVDDVFFKQNVAYYEQPGYGNTQYFSGVVAATNFSYKPQPSSQAPAAYGYSYAYDAMKRLRAAADSASTSGTVLIGAQSYDGNGNVRQLARGVTTETFSFQASASSPTQNNNQLYNVIESVATFIDFSGDVAGWSFGASNGGPSASTIVPYNTGHALQLAGGSLGHFEFLQLDSYLAPNGVYQLVFEVMTPANFSNSTGNAGWYLIVRTTGGIAFDKKIGSIPDTAGAWQTITLPNLDLGNLIGTLAPGAAAVSVTVALRNYLRPKSGTGPGPAITVTGITLTTTTNVAGGVYSYYPSGAVKTAPDRAITLINYDPVNRQPRQIQKSSGSQAYSYDGSDSRLLATAGSATRRYLRDPASNPMRIDDAALNPVYCVYGPTGLLGVQSTSGFSFVLKDSIGSTRVVVNDSNQVVEAIDYLPSGETMRVSGASSNRYLFTGQEFDSETGLYNFPARLYDPALGRFYSPDDAGESPSPYVYADNNPVGLIDPDGNAPQWVNAGIDRAKQFYQDHPYLVIGGTTAAVAGLGVGAFFYFPGALGAVALAVGEPLVPVWHGIVLCATNPFWAGRTGLTWLYHHPRYSLQLGLLAYRIYSSPSWFDFAKNSAIDISVSVVSAHTVLRVLHVADAFIQFRNPIITWPLGAIVLGAEGAIRGQMRRGVEYLISDNSTRAGIEFFRWEDAQRDAFYNIVAHGLFTSLDFRTAISPRAAYPRGTIYVFYLKFPVAWSQWRTARFWRGWIVPYKGKASGHGSALAVGHVRHNDHHWNDYGFGSHITIAASENADAIDYLERWAIQYFKPAQHINGPAGYQQNWGTGTATAIARRADFIREFFAWHYQYALTHLSTPPEVAATITEAFINGTIGRWWD